MKGTLDEVRDFWDRVADDWRELVGDHGDANHQHVSGPVLWRMLGDVDGLRVLDAGSGTGYLSAELARRGARVTGVDLSERMVEIARELYPGIDFRIDSLSELATVDDASIDVVVAHYVLMDTPDLDGAVKAFARVLRPGGSAVAVFSHPCFPQGRADVSADGRVAYTWDFPYFEERCVVDPAWAHFRSEFIWFHRPLSRYWAAFKDAGLVVEELDEPRTGPEGHPDIDDDRFLHKARVRPYSIAFKLRKGGGTA